jgi:salicylate hydroxylase
LFLISQLIENPDVWALFEHPLAPYYHNKRICLLGDSAHCTTPHFGAGGGLALEDAYILSNLLGLCTSVTDILNAFKAYDIVRIPRTHRVIKDSNEQGKIMDLEATGIGDDLEKTAQKLDTTVRWIWRVDLPKQLEEAVVIFEKEKVSGELEEVTVPLRSS